MKKLLFTFFALILCTSLGWGAVTKIEASIATFASDSSWSQTATSYHPYLQLDENVSVKAKGTSNGTHSTNRWFLYQTDNKGEFTISAADGYWIDSIGFNNKPQNTGVISRVSGKSQSGSNIIPSSTSIKAVNAAVNAQSITLYIGNSADVDNGTARIYTIYVNYDLAPTGVSLNVPAAMNATVGNKFQIIATVAPSTTVFQAVKWTTSNADAVDVDQNGIIDVKGAGQATITATTVNGKTATCVIDAAATTDESFIEDYAKLGEQATLKSSYTQFEGTYGQPWRVRNFIHSSATELSSGVSGVAIQGGAINFVAYANANVEGGVKRVAFQWRAVDATKPVNFDVDDPADAANTRLSTRLAANSDYANVQSYSRDVNRDKNYQLRIMVADAASSNIVVGPVTVTPYLLYKTKQAEATGTYKNEDLINNTGATPTFTLEDNDGEASIADDGTVTCLKEGEVTVKASWNGGQVYTTYTLTTHVKPIPDITFGNTIIDAFGSYTPAPVAKLGVVTIEDAQWTYTSSNAAVATVNEGVFTITGAGTSTITATIVAGETYASTSATATLTVNEPTVGVWKEKYDSLGSTGTEYNKDAEPTYFYSKDKAYRWQVRNYQYNNADNNKVNGEDGIRIRTEQNDKNYIATGTPLEGGVKAVFFNWQMAGSGAKTSDFTVSVTETHLTDYSEPVQLAVTAGQYRSYVDKSVDYKANGMFRVKINSAEKAAVFGPMIIKPYLLYTRKDTAIKAMDYETAGFKYTNKDTINNTNGEGVITYAIEDAANKADIATIDSESGEVTIVGDGTVKVIAKWKHDPENSPLDSVTTSYNLTILLRKHGVKFEHKDTTVYLKDGGSYTQEVAKACASAVPVYSFEGEYGTCGINSATGEVTFTEPDTVVVKATVPQVLPYKGGSATYTLRINRSDIDPATLSFQIAENPVEKNMNDAPFTNALTGVPAEGAGTVTYTSNKPKVATVDLNSGLVTIIGAGTATITANVADGTMYNKTSKAYTLEVTEPEGEKSYTETFKAYKTEGWVTASDVETTKEGDYFKWDVLKARHDDNGSRDYLYNGNRATWLNKSGYIRTQDTLQGGIKRISFKWNKVTQGSVRALFSLFWTEDNSGYDQVDVNPVETGETETLHNPDFDYSHNFFLKRNVPLRIVNSAKSQIVLGDITITPYIFFKDSLVDVKYEDVKLITFKNQGTIDNTHSQGVMRYISSNESVASVDNSGNITPHKGCDTPIRITAIWKESAEATDSVMAWYKLLIRNKSLHHAQFEHDTVTIKLNETPVNTLLGYDIPANPTYSSSETSVASIVSNAVKAKGIGTTIVKAVIPENALYQADSATYVLMVKPVEDAEHTLAESFDGVVFDATAQTKLKGDLNKYGITWDKNDVSISRDPTQKIGGKQGTWMRQAALLTTSNVMEGGVKYFSCNWRQPNTESNTTIKVGLFLDDAAEPVFATSDRRINDQAGVGSEQQYYYAANVAHKSNAKLTFKNLSNNPNAQNGRIIFDTIKVVPYLFYTAKDTTLVANEMEGVYTFTNDKLINNTEDTEAANFTYKVLAKDNAVSIADEHSGEITIIGAGTDTIEAAWEGVKTTYVVHVVLEDAGLDFAKKDSTVLLNTGTCTQTASKTTTADVKYEFEGEHGTATINETTGEVTFNGQTGTFTILASVPVALPYDLDSARYTLTVNNKPTPTISFNNVEKDMNAVPFQNPMNGSYTGLGQAHYFSADPSVATVVENSGLITIVGQGNATINVHFDEGDDWGEADASFTVSVTDPNEDKVKENFVKQNNWGPSATSINGNLFTWNTVNTRRNVSKEVLANGDSAVWFSGLTSYIESAEKIEGGIKRVSFYYNKYDNNTVNLKFLVSVNGVAVDSACQAEVAGTTRAATDFWFNHNIGVKENAKLKISHPVAGVTAHLGYINITPYLFYTTKRDTLDLKKGGNTITLVPQIDNRDDKDNPLSKINYSILEGGEIAEIDDAGVVTATGSGQVVVQAQWSTNTGVTTTDTLTILPAKTVIKLMHNDGTDGYNTIENTIGAQMEAEVVIPTRTGYRFNAYFIDAAASKQGNRMTATNPSGVTSWVNAVRTYNNVTYINNRVWVYPGAECTIYANWMPERKIALDNQDETTPDTVYTAICANNDAVNLLTPVTVPEKVGYTFLGYYTEAENGTQIVDENGAFKASVEGYTDNKTKWQKDVEITTVYAHWEASITLKDNEPNEAMLTPLIDGDPIKVNLVRSFTAGEYNTICLPFDVNKETMKAKFGENYELATLDSTHSASLDDTQENLSIYIVAEDSIKAGLPYLIKLAAPVSNPSFENVVVKCAKGSSIASKDEVGKQVQFCGLLSPKSVPTNKSVLFVVKNDKLAWNSTGAAKNMNGMRAYFHVDGVSTGVAARLAFYKPSTPTELENLNDNHNDNRKVLINDQIYIIRNGVYYNVSGQIVR